MYWMKMSVLVEGTIRSKIHLITPKGGRFCEENSLRYLDLCYDNPHLRQITDLPSIIGCEPIRKLQEIVFVKSATCEVNCILLSYAQQLFI